MTPYRFTWLAAAALLGTSLAAQAQGIDRQARTWAANCAACHGSDGKPKGEIPAIAGKSADQIHRLLLEFKNGQRPSATVMHQHAKGYTDDELLRIAQALAAAGASK
jgi:cytochrome subunit of sulfide dehydrogenase